MAQNGNHSPRLDVLTIAANGDEVRRASEWLSESGRRHEVPQPQVERLELCLNEALANVLAHGGSTARMAPIHLQLEVRLNAATGEARVTVVDAGIAFNPAAAPEPARPKTLAEAEPGGLGLPMIRRCADWLDYRREDGHNHFTFGARWALL